MFCHCFHILRAGGKGQEKKTRAGKRGVWWRYWKNEEKTD